MESHLTSVTISSSVVELEYGAFQYCQHLKKVLFAENGRLEKIGSKCFSGTAIAHIAIPDSVRSLGYEVFNGCVHLKDVVFRGKKLESIEGNLFSYSPNKTVVYVPKDMEFDIEKRIGENCTVVRSLK